MGSRIVTTEGWFFLWRNSKGDKNHGGVRSRSESEVDAERWSVKDERKARNPRGVENKNHRWWFLSVSDGALIKLYSTFSSKSVDNRGIFDLNDANIYHQSAAAYYPNKVVIDEGVVDLTDAFDSVATIKEVEKLVEKIVKKGGEYFTKTPNKKIKLPKGKYREGHLAHSNGWEKMQIDEKERHNMYVEAYKELIENSVYSRTTLNKDRSNKHKKNVNKYHYFTVDVRIGNTVYKVVLDTEEFDGNKTTNHKSIQCKRGVFIHAKH